MKTSAGSFKVKFGKELNIIDLTSVEDLATVLQKEMSNKV